MICLLPDFQDTICKNIDIISGPVIDSSSIKDGRLQIIKSYLITSFDSGFYQVPPVYAEIKNDNGLKRFYSDYSQLEVMRVKIAPADTTAKFYDIIKPYRAPVTVGDILPWVLIALLSAALIWAAVRYFRKHKNNEKGFLPEVIPDPAHIIAFRELEKLKGEELWQKGEIKNYYTRLTEILRQYLEHRFNVFSFELTTRETLDALLKTGFKKDKSYNILKDILTGADLVKFAKYTPDSSENEAQFQASWDFVTATKIDEQVEITPAAQSEWRGGKTMNKITFADPAFLYLLVIIPAIIAFYFFKQRKATASLRMPGLDPFLNSGKTFRHYLRHILFALRIIAVALLIIVLARPQATDRFQDVSTEGIDIILALDISGSMLSRDFKPDRLEASKNVATEFISGRPYDRIGLVIFSGEAFTQCPLTTDHAVLINLLRQVKSGMIEDGTAIGTGLATAINRIKDSDAKSKVIILLTDGVNNRGEIAPETAASIAKLYGIRVYTIGVGTEGMAPYPVQTPYGIQYQDMPVEIDEGLLKEIAQTTGGKYFRATDNDKLEQVYQEIDKMEKSKIDVKQFSRKEEKYFPAALIAFILLVLEFLARNTIFKNLT